MGPVLLLGLHCAPPNAVSDHVPAGPNVTPAIVWSGVEDSVLEDGELYRLVQDTSDHIHVLTARDTSLITDKDAVFPEGVEQVDLDQDGHADVVVNLFSNTPGDQLHFLFDTASSRFVPLRNALYYANTRPLKGTHLCYSYNRAGCADYSWESWLFGIANDSAYSIGHMEARICPTDPDPRVLVHRAVGNTDLERVDSIPADTSMAYQQGKWEMIQGYWMKHHKLFLRPR